MLIGSNEIKCKISRDWLFKSINRDFSINNIYLIINYVYCLHLESKIDKPDRLA